MWFPKNLSINVKYYPAIPFLKMYSKENSYPNKYLFMNIHSNIHTSQQVEKIQMSSMDKWIKNIFLFLYNGVLFIHKSKWSIGTWMNLENITSKEARNKRSHIAWIFIWNVQNWYNYRDGVLVVNEGQREERGWVMD